MRISSRIGSSFIQRALLLLALVQLGCYASNGCFGTNCRYQCHCRLGSRDCDKETGNCSSGCEIGWFGPGCQYEAATTNHTPWLHDNNGSSCNPGYHGSIAHRLIYPLQFTWMTLEFKSYIESPKKISFATERLEPITSYYKATCTRPDYTKISPGVFQVTCPSKDLIRRIFLSGGDVSSLCSLYVYTGRVLPLSPKKTVSTNFSGWITEKPILKFHLSPELGNRCVGSSSDFSGILSMSLYQGKLARAMRFYVEPKAARYYAVLPTGHTFRALHDGNETFRYDAEKDGGSFWAFSKETGSIVMNSLEYSSRFPSLRLQYCYPNCTKYPEDLGCTPTCNCREIDLACLKKLEGCQELCSPDGTQRSKCMQFCCTRRFKDFRLIGLSSREKSFYRFDERMYTKYHLNRTILEAVSEKIREIFNITVTARIYGESICPENRWGRDCEKTCSCKSPEETCLVGTGVCVPGKGECRRLGRFGRGCTYWCHCLGEPDDCDVETGYCRLGCENGWFGSSCQYRCHCQGACDRITGLCGKDCDHGWFGPACRKPCLRNCSRDVGNCFRDTGWCCKKGFFGFKCKYECRCKNKTDLCNEDNGHCRSGCQDGWFGPGCQYAVNPLVVKRDEKWATDSNPHTCYNGSRSYLEFSLTVPIHFTWMRLEFAKDVHYPPDLQISLKKNKKIHDTTLCVNVNGKEFVVHKNTKRTLDIMCTTKTKVGVIGFSGKLLQHLCSVYVSIGSLLVFKRPKKLISTTHKLYTYRTTFGLVQTFERYVQSSLPKVRRRKKQVCDLAQIHDFGGVVSFDLSEVDLPLLPRTTTFRLRLPKYQGHPEMWTHFNLSTVDSKGIKDVFSEEDVEHKDDALPSVFKDSSWDLKILNVSFDARQFELGYCKSAVPRCKEGINNPLCKSGKCDCKDPDDACLGKLDVAFCIRHCGSQKRFRTDCEDYCCNRRLVNFTLSAFTYNPYPHNRTKYYEFTREDCGTRCRRVQTKLEVVSEEIQKFFKHVQLTVYADPVCPLKKWGRYCELPCECPDSKQCFASTGFCPQCNNSCVPGGKTVVATGEYIRTASDNRGLLVVANAVTVVSTFVVLGTIAAILVKSFKGPEMAKVTTRKQRGVTEPASGLRNEHPGDVIDPTTKAANERPAE